MKLAIPALGIIVAAGGCCCCGGLTDELSELGIPVDGEEVVVDVPEEPGGDAAPVAPASGGGGGSVAALDGTCGRFASMGIGAPSGSTVMACSDDSGTGGLVIKTTASPKDACAVMKSWASGNGWNVTLESGMGGTSSIMTEKGADQLIFACNDMTGSTTISVALTAK